MNPIHTVHSAAAYAPVYTFEPPAMLWLALLLLVIGGTLLFDGLRRARRHTSWSEETGRRPAMRLLEDTRLQRRLGAGALAAALAFAGLGLLVQEKADRNLRDNIMAKYDVVAVEEISGRGDGFVADLHWADGTVDRGELIHLAAGDEPFVGAFEVELEEGGDMVIVHAARTVYTWEPGVLYAAAFLALVGGVALFVWGRRRAAAERALIREAESSRAEGAERVRTLDRQDWRRLRRWERVRNAGIGLACGFLVLGFFGLHTRDQAFVNLRANILDVYKPQLAAVDEIEPADGGYRVELHWRRPGNDPELEEGEYDAIVVPDVLVTLEDRRHPTVTQIPDEVVREWPEDVAEWPAVDR